jgi:Ca2+-transporting ATPase
VRNLHSNIHSSFRNGLFSNKSLLLGILVSALIMFAVLLIPGLMELFGIVPMDPVHWVLTAGLSLVPILVVELVKWAGINHSKDEY